MKDRISLVVLVPLAALLGAAMLIAGCSSSSSPDDDTPWYDGAVWSARADFPPNSGNHGASLEWDGDDSIYATRGHDGSSVWAFWRYDVPADSWTQLEDSTIDHYWGTTLVYTGGDYIYMIQGNGTDDFCRYSISGDSWQEMASFPESGVRRAGRGLAWPGSGDYIYAIKGNNATVFARYSQSGDSWEYIAPLPEAVPYGASICWGGEDDIYATAGDSSFYRYDIALGAWSQLADMPAPIYFGSWMCWDGDNSLFVLRGNGTAEFWRYDMTDDAWETLEDVPGTVVEGGSLACNGSAVYAFQGGSSTSFWVFR
jgi:N-acetylneuraminic acid mutarotase